MTKLLLIDNYDSFVYNLAQAFGALGAEVEVVRNDASLSDCERVHPDAVVVSPGPGTPQDAGVSVAAIKSFAARIPVLGVCLGHQCIGVAFGGRIERAPVGPVHGKTSAVEHDGRGVFEGLPSPLVATRYHSLALEEAAFPGEFVPTARSDDGTLMGICYVELAVYVVQFLI